LYAPYSEGPIFRVSADGGEPRQVTTPDTARGETGHRFPQFLPDGRHFIYSSLPAHDGKFDIYLGALGYPGRIRLLAVDAGACYAEAGYLLYTRGGRLVAQRFDVRAGRLRGAPLALGDIPAPTTFSGAAEVTASRNGVIAFNTRIVRDTRLAWFDLQGHETAGGPLPPGPYLGHALSPDGRRAIVNRESSDGSSDLWMVDLAGGAAIRLTDGVGRCGGPCWGPDGREIAYTWENNTPQRIVVMSTENGARRTL